MSNPTSPLNITDLLSLVTERIRQLENDEDSLFYRKLQISDIVFRPKGLSPNGSWYNIHTGRPKVFRLIGELNYDLTLYADIRTDSYPAVSIHI